MIIVYSEAHRSHSPSHEIYDGQPVKFAEASARAGAIIGAIREKKLGRIIAPRQFARTYIESIHQQDYIEFIRSSSNRLPENGLLFPSFYISDTYAPITSGTYAASRKAVDVALTAASLLLDDEAVAYALCRPPGHHAAHHSMGGYCYFNNAAIAANYLSQKGRVAILDIDFHHGNGTQDAFYDRNDVLYVSLHADPHKKYPYASGYKEEVGRDQGTGFNINYPLPLGTAKKLYISMLRNALLDIVNFSSDFLIVSLGFDTYIDDPIGGFELNIEDYADIAMLVKDLALPTLLIQEGGYNVEKLGQMASQFLSVWW